MLSKLINHEFRATGRIMLPVIAAVIVLSVLSGAGIGLMDLPNIPGIVNVIFTIFIVLFFLSLFAIGVVSVVIMVQRFYRNLMRDEGYLSMTLPVTVDEHIFAKLIVSYVWFIAVFVLCIVAIYLMFLTTAAGEISFNPVNTTELEEVGEQSSYLISLIGAGNIIAFILEALLLSFIGSCGLCLRFYSAMAVGCSAAEHKVLLSVLAYFGIGIALNTIGFSLLALFGNSNLAESFSFAFDSSSGFGGLEEDVALLVSIIHRFLLTANGICLAYAAIHYFITRFFLSRKLNLA